MRLATLVSALAVTFAAAQPATSVAQPTIERVAAGPAYAGGAFVDAGFQHAYSFRATGFAPGSGGADAVVGGVGACHAGDACNTSLTRTFTPGQSSYFVGINFGGPFYGSPSLYVNAINAGGSGTELFLEPYVPDAALNAFYIVLTPPVGGTIALNEGFFVGAPPTDAPGFAAGGAGSRYALFRYADLRHEFLFFDLDITGNDAGAGAPSIEVYVGSLAVTATPEPGTWALTASGLLVMMALVHRRTRRALALAVTRTASSPRP